MLPQVAGVVVACGPDDTPPEHYDQHEIVIGSLGTFTEVGTGAPSQIMVEVGNQFLAKSGQKTVPLKIVSIGGTGFAEGLGATRFWLDATRPVTSAIWEKQLGTEFPAIQEMRFHFFYTMEAMPGKVFRSVNPAVMRSDDVRAFPPPPGTVYHLAKAVDLEDASEPGVVIGRIVSNRVVIPKSRVSREPVLRGAN
ncbi:MAG TPA: hypothetical protein VF173_26240 [Thermoanaerobaculia bacterium]|nr:hypothetical protein [Thermoanaerobaculia bacterium]